MSGDFLMRWLGPGFANGLGLGLWLRLLAENRFHVSLPHAGRAASITAAACWNSLVGCVENVAYGRAMQHADVPPPLIVLGVARSGTTHLHNLLAQDARFAFPTTFQALNPRTFLLTERWRKPVERRFFPTTRLMDNMEWGVDAPAEDELAIMSLCGLSPLASWLFPRNCGRYDRYFDFSQSSRGEQEQWKRALAQFVRKLHVRDQRPLVLKSPFHTPRVRMLLELFPDAKFVLIHRHPYDVYLSTLHMTEKALPYATLQTVDKETMRRRTIRAYRLFLDGYFEQRHLIPAGRLVEIGFEQIEQAPIATLRRVYQELSLPAFAEAEPAVERYLAKISGYRKNRLTELSVEEKAELAREWSRSFAEWGYEA